MRPNGCLEHLGRKDWQVKIRGYRVEIPEIEMALLALDTIKEAAVVAQEDGTGGKRLIAYLVPSGPSAAAVSTMRRALAETLPDYMIPAVFIMLDSLPFTPNGKVDRNALPAPSSVYPQLDNPYVAPRTAVEEALAAIWAEVLNLTRVGIHDDFFALGGHSLLATQMIARVSRALRVDVPLRAFFETPTIAGMALCMTQQQVEGLEHAEIERLLAEIEGHPIKRSH